MIRSSALTLSASLLVLGLAAPAPALAPDGALARFVKPSIPVEAPAPADAAAEDPEATETAETGDPEAPTADEAAQPDAGEPTEASEGVVAAGVAVEETGAEAPDAAAGDVADVDDPAAPASPAPAPMSPEEELDRVSAYLDTITTLEGRFLQVEPDGGLASGKFYLQRPGKVRFEYDPPHPSLIVSDGATVAHQDRDLETIDRAPLRQTPLHLFLKADVDLGKDAEIMGLRRADGFLFVEVRDPDEEVEGALTLVFATPALELREWIVRDALGQDTRVMLQGVRPGGAIDPALFVLRDPAPRRRGGR